MHDVTQQSSVLHFVVGQHFRVGREALSKRIPAANHEDKSGNENGHSDPRNHLDRTVAVIGCSSEEREQGQVNDVVPDKEANYDQGDIEQRSELRCSLNEEVDLVFDASPSSHESFDQYRSCDRRSDYHHSSCGQRGRVKHL
jgi:hypothetical protein